MSPPPDGGPGPASVMQSGPGTVGTSLQIGGVDLRQGFTLTGTVTLSWGIPMPTGSALAFQIKVGSWVPPAPASTPPLANAGCDCTCSCSSTLELFHDNPSAVGNNPAGMASSAHPVRYFDGTARVVAADFSSMGFGAAYGQTRSWTNQEVYATLPLVYPQ